MAEALKDFLNPQSVGEIAAIIKKAYPAFDETGFLQHIFTDEWPDLELKNRFRQITHSFAKHMPADYPQTLEIIDRMIEIEVPRLGFFIPDFIEVYGQDPKHRDLSVSALARYTQYWSSEMAVRPFIVSDEARMLKTMKQWAVDENEHIRRLASEGCRPALPWSMALNKYKQDPTPILPILELLKSDPSAYVRKSVANNLNDISKTHPDLVLDIAKRWYGACAETDWIVKHACRTLLKKGNVNALALFGFEDKSTVTVTDFTLDKSSLAIGKELGFSFKLLTTATTKVRLEYAIDFVKANGKSSRKVFQISEITIPKDEQRNYNKLHSFADLSTRKHYPGLHKLTLIVNGQQTAGDDFTLTV